MTLYCGVTWIAVLLRTLCGGLFLSASLPWCVWEGCGRGCVRGSERGWLPAPPRALENSIQVDLLDGVARHPGRGEEEDGEGLLWQKVDGQDSPLPCPSLCRWQYILRA
ncbi:hypothetical protein TcCL_NonESM09449 [Trypanosoma cruzi]|nr:hypothetical protein TcCL_NonESM09449 [Trypanosoma cruzi]